MVYRLDTAVKNLQTIKIPFDHFEILFNFSDGLESRTSNLNATLQFIFLLSLFLVIFLCPAVQLGDVIII